MDTVQCIATKLDIRDYAQKDVPSKVKVEILNAARMAGTGMNKQHWRFILVQGKDRLDQLAKDSTSGSWVRGANFAVIVLTDPKYGFHKLDAGRAMQNMQLAAWSNGVISCIYTGINEESLRRDFEFPKELNPSVVVSFGYPSRRLTGRRKNRLPLEEVAFFGSFGKRLEPESLH